MKLSKALTILGQTWGTAKFAFLPTLRAVLKQPTLLLRPSELSQVYMAHVWVPFGNGLDGNTRELKESLITPNASGVVLDIGAGHGHTVQYLDRDKVTKYVALEPNELMHTEIRTLANSAGFTEAAGTLLVLPYGAEHISLINSALGREHSVDTITSIISLCSVPEPRITIRALCEQVLKPSGTFLFYEHVLSIRSDVAWWQWVWTPLWKWVFGGCCLDRPTDRWLEEVGNWRSKDIWEDEDKEHIFWHRGGKLVKA